LLAFALGIAFRNTEAEPARVAVEEGTTVAEQAGARRLFNALSARTGVQAALVPAEAADRSLRTGKVDVVVRASGSDLAAYQFHFDPTRPESRQARLLVDDELQRALGRQDVATVTEERVTDPGARYIDFLIPGLIGLNLMGSGMWGIGFAIVDARMKKLLKRLAATPMRRSHFLLSFVLSRLIFLFLEVAAIVAFGWIAFGVRVQGSLPALVATSLLAAMTFAGLGLLVAARPRTIEGVSGWMNLVMLPMWLLSGTFFSATRFPEVLQPFIKALPLTAANDALRAIINEGAGFAGNGAPLVVLAAWGLVSFIGAVRIFRWQ